MNILFASSELFPLIKTGGLADVAYNLPVALHELGHDVRVILPGYRQVLEKMGPKRHLLTHQIGDITVDLLLAELPGVAVPLYVVDCPRLFDREGGPYGHYSDNGWPDNAERFGLFCQMIAWLAMNGDQLSWQADVLHGNDWQTGLAIALVSQHAERPATVFTIHNLAYQGLFPEQTLARLGLPPAWWDFRALEFYGQLSFIKGGIAFADAVNTVSPNYAKEVITQEHGCGLDGLLRYRGKAFRGIVNGIDTQLWDPASDIDIHLHYSKNTLQNKTRNRDFLLGEFHLPNDNRMLIGIVSRLTEQKGIDLVLQALDKLHRLPVKLIVLGSGEPEYERALQQFANEHPEFLVVCLGYNEALAHQMMAGIDALLIPSRYEPCGLTQLYSQRYGTIPIARKTGGLADTIIDDAGQGIQNRQATGFLFNDYTCDALVDVIERALQAYHEPRQWRSMQLNAMAQNFSWAASAKQYVEMYQSVSRSEESIPYAYTGQP